MMILKALLVGKVGTYLPDLCGRSFTGSRSCLLTIEAVKLEIICLRGTVSFYFFPLFSRHLNVAQ